MKVRSIENDDIIKWVKDVTFDFYASNFHADYKRVIDRQKKFTFAKQPEKEKPVEKKVDGNVPIPKDPFEPDVFNVGDHNDKKKFKNDVHNGVFDLMNIDPSMIMGKKKKGMKFVNCFDFKGLCLYILAYLLNTYFITNFLILSRIRIKENRR